MNDAPASDAHFDETLNAWVFSRYADVHAALHHASIVAHGSSASGRAIHLETRRAMADLLSNERISIWRVDMAARATDRVARLPTAGSFDLVQDLFVPWSRDVACIVTGISRELADDLAPLAHDVYLAAARATDGRPTASAQQSTALLARALAEAPRAYSHLAQVQSFVALTQSLPATLANIWHELLHDSTQRHALREAARRPDPGWPHIVAELLRLAGPARTIFRYAIDRVTIGAARLNARDHVVLMITAANTDPEYFAAPHRFDFARPPHKPLALGAGAHRCAGAALVQLAVESISIALLHVPMMPSTDKPAAWVGGDAMRGRGEVVASRESGVLRGEY